jgi:UDP-3-O-[3-hydroxymyristoyl] glucosamine N-acyltransferase
MLAPEPAKNPFMLAPELCIFRDVTIHPSVRIVAFVNIYASTIGAGCMIAPFVEIGGAVIGECGSAAALSSCRSRSETTRSSALAQ